MRKFRQTWWNIFKNYEQTLKIIRGNYRKFYWWKCGSEDILRKVGENFSNENVTKKSRKNVVISEIIPKKYRKMFYGIFKKVLVDCENYGSNVGKSL